MSGQGGNGQGVGDPAVHGRVSDEPSGNPHPVPEVDGTEERPPSSVELAGVLMVVSGGLTSLTALLLFAVATLGIGGSLLGVLSLALGGLQVYLGLQLQQLVEGARTGAVLVSAAAVVLGLVLVTRSGTSGVLGMILPAVVLYLLYRVDSRAAFPPSGRPLGL